MTSLHASAAARDLRALALGIESGELSRLIEHAAMIARTRAELADADEEIVGDLTSPTWWAATLAAGASLSEAAIVAELRRARVGRWAVAVALMVGFVLGRWL